jgi:hypothetical protein
LRRRGSIGTAECRPCEKIDNPTERKTPNILKRAPTPTIPDKGGISTQKPHCTQAALLDLRQNVLQSLKKIKRISRWPDETLARF